MHYTGVVWPDSHSLKNCSSTTSLYALTGSGRDLKNFGRNKAGIAIKFISPESLCITLSKYVASPCEPFSADFVLKLMAHGKLFSGALQSRPTSSALIDIISNP